MKDPFQAYQLELEVLSPVHVGTGEVFPAYAYQLDTTNNKVRILDVDKLLAILPPDLQDNYFEAVAGGPKQAQTTLSELSRSGKVDLTPAVVREIATSRSFNQTVLEAIDEAALEFRPLPVSPLGPYIPGSSLKGALRTAWIYQQTAGQEWRLEPGDRWSNRKGEGQIILPTSAFSLRSPFAKVKAKISTNFEARLLDYMGNGGPNLYQDPFRSLKVADSAPLTKTLLNRLRVFHRGADVDMDLTLLAETVPRKDANSLPQKISFDLRFQPGLANNPLEPEPLAKACRSFYGHVRDEEADFALEFNMATAKKEVYDEIAKRLADPAHQDGFPVRFGFGSGGLATTLALVIQGSAIPATRKGAGGTDAQLSYPLGWLWGQLKPL